MQTHHQMLKQLWSAAIDSVQGKKAVQQAIINDTAFAPDLIISVGKAASGMYLGAFEELSARCPALVVTKYDHAEPRLKSMSQVELFESAHPIPDEQSLLAGELLINAVSQLSETAKLLVLVSGGASSLAESLIENQTLDDLQHATDALIAGGKTIAQINAYRKSVSQLKDGRLLAQFKGAACRVYAISDVEGDSISVIGSGLGDCKHISSIGSSKIIGSNQIARQHLSEKAKVLGFPVKINEESLYDDVFVLAKRIGVQLKAVPKDSPAVFIWGGEPTIRLPSNPGSGGRNQSLALALAEQIQNLENITLLVAGTDGTDGPTDAAGGIVDGQTWLSGSDAQLYLNRADAGSYLQRHQSLFITGPTNTNVMDLVIAIVG